MQIFDYQLEKNGDILEIKEEKTSTQSFILLDFTILSEFELYIVGVKKEKIQMNILIGIVLIN